jgi:lipopolysaccharide transport system permease protein
MEHVLIPPPSAKPLLIIRPGRGRFVAQLAEAWRFRDLLMGLAGRDVRLRYRQTVLGAAWVVLQPLLAAAVFAFVFGRVAGLSSGGVPYFLFSYSGLLAWGVFFAVVTKASLCLVGNAALVSKIYFPRVVLPLSTVPSALLDFAVALALLAVLMPVYRVRPGLPLLSLPLWLGLVLLLGAGLGLVTAALTVRYRDVQYVLPVLMQLLLYASPVAYSVARVPARLRAVYFLNPLSGLLEAFRWSLLGGAPPPWGYVTYAAAFSVAALAAGLWWIGNTERSFADVI